LSIILLRVKCHRVSGTFRYPLKFSDDVLVLSWFIA
jgi:hypothetical protein